MHAARQFWRAADRACACLSVIALDAKRRDSGGPAAITLESDVQSYRASLGFDSISCPQSCPRDMEARAGRRFGCGSTRRLGTDFTLLDPINVCTPIDAKTWDQWLTHSLILPIMHKNELRGECRVSVRIDLPFDDLVNCWALVREIARAIVPDLNPKAAGIECVVAKRPDPIAITVPQDVPDIGGQAFEAQAVEQMLTDSDRQYLLCVLPDLPELKIPFPDEIASAFLEAFRALPDRPAWQPVLLSEARWLQEDSRIIAERWAKASQHLQVLQHWLDTGRIRAFRSRHVPATELLVGTLIPRQDVLTYLDYCEIIYIGEETAAAFGERGATPGKSVVEDAAGTQEDEVILESGPVPRSIRVVRGAAPQSTATKEDPSAQIVQQRQAIPTGPLLDIKEVSKRTGISVSMLHEKMKASSKYFDPTFPEKVSLGARTVRYDQNSIDAWIQAQMTRQTS